VLRCTRSSTPLFTTPMSAAAVIDSLRLYMSRILAPRATLHGVFLDILGMGVLLTGDSGLGKSELGLELISRGHGLVADDERQPWSLVESGSEIHIDEVEADRMLADTHLALARRRHIDGFIDQSFGPPHLVHTHGLGHRGSSFVIPGMLLGWSESHRGPVVNSMAWDTTRKVKRGFHA